MSAKFTISTQHPSLPGHFPGRPIVPGVIVLQHALLEATKQYPQLQITGIRKLKLLQALLPSQEVEVQCLPPSKNTLRFRCYHKKQLLADGKFFVTPIELTG